MLFQKSQNTLKEISHIDFKLEKDIQKLLENNLGIVFGLEFLETEFPLKDMRFDTVAYDEENASFVIIEYKKVRNTSLVDQGYAYLHTVLDRKAELVLLYNKVKNERKQVADFSWDMTRIYFVSPYFSKFQRRRQPCPVGKFPGNDPPGQMVGDLNLQRLAGDGFERGHTTTSFF